MKLCEVTSRNSQYIGKIPIITPKRPPNDEAGDHVGVGAQSLVRSFPKQMNSVIKYTELQHLEDPYLIFVNLILNHQDNPFFPKIYNIKLYDLREFDDAKSSYMLIINMEKLRPIFNKNISDSTHELFKRLGFDESQLTKYDRGFADHITADAYMTASENRAQLIKTTKNPQFREALQLLEPYFKKFGTDLHNRNWRLRMSNVGSQLVIIDPFTILGGMKIK